VHLRAIDLCQEDHGGLSILADVPVLQKPAVTIAMISTCTSKAT
jgi:hypothetical protein